MTGLRAAAAALCAVLLCAAAPGWRAVDPENLLVVDTTAGRILVEMRPDFAPKSVERVKLLAREGVYDGLQIHRVVDGFVNQTGNPNNKDGGVSRHPDLPAEFSFRLAGEPTIVRRSSDGVEGFVGATPFAGVSDAEKARSPLGRRAWGAYCAGVVGMGRQADPDSANSEIFFMRAPARRLDHEYAVWGRVVVGMEAVMGAAIGEPPAKPDLMTRVRVAADLPPAERPRIEVMDERGAAFAEIVKKLRRENGADFSVCDASLPVRASN